METFNHENVPKEIWEKVEKLLAFQEDRLKAGAQAEAENAAMKIQDILLKYNIDLSQRPGQKERLEIKERYINAENAWDKRWGDGLKYLYSAVAKANLASCLWIAGRNDKVIILGYQHNLEIIQYTVEQLLNKLVASEKADWHKVKDNGWEKRGTFRRGYFINAVAAIAEKLRIHTQQVQSENESLPILFNQTKQEIEKYMAQAHPKVGTANSRGTKSRIGADMGYEAGRKMEINKGVGNASVGTNLLGR